MSFFPNQYFASIITKVGPINNAVTLGKLLTKLDHLKNKIHIKELDLVRTHLINSIMDPKLSLVIDQWVNNTRKEILINIRRLKKSKKLNGQNEKIKVEKRKKAISAAVKEVKLLMKGKKAINDAEEKLINEKHKEHYRLIKEKSKLLLSGEKKTTKSMGINVSETEEDPLHRK